MNILTRSLSCITYV